LSDGQEARYTVTFLGPAHNDIANVNRLAQGLKDRFKLSDEAVTKVMKMAPVVIKKGATSSEAQRYKEALEAIGARVQLEQESIEEARGQPQQTEGSPSSLDREPQIIPVKAKTPPPSPETAATEEEAGQQMTTCPQCGVAQEATDECIKCGVIISKFLKYQTEVKPAEAEGFAPGAAGTPTAGPQPSKIIGTPIEEPTGSTPWEDMAILGFFRAFFRTMKEVLFSPTVFFRRMAVDKGISNPLFYGVITSFLATIIALLGQYAVAGFIGSFIGGEDMKGMEGVNLFQVTFILIYAFFFPILAAIVLFIGSGILHLCLLIVGAGKRGFETTFRVVAYTCSTQVFSLVPFIGPFIYFFYTLVVYVIGLRESHRTTTGRALIAVLLPMVIVLFFIGLIVFAVILPLIFSQQGQTMQQEPPSF
jgi:hypothetical protein